MRVIVQPDHEQMSRAACAVILEAIGAKPGMLLGVATGGTPTRTYELLALAGQQDRKAFADLRVLKIDEWGGLGVDDAATCEVYVRERVLRPLSIGDRRYFGWDSDPDDAEEECRRMAEVLAREGPIDLCVLGVGTNGHLALNEPGEALRSGAHVARLSESSLRHPMLLTIGMGDILRSRRLLVLAGGRGKAEVVRRLLENDAVTPYFPASFLHLHGDAVLVCDREAAGTGDAPPDS